MQSALLGLAVLYNLAPDQASGQVLGFLSSFQLTAKGDVLKTFFSEFHYDRAEVPNTLALILSLELRAIF